MAKEHSSKFGVSDFVDAFTGICDPNTFYTTSWNATDFLKDDIPFRYTEKNGLVCIDVVVAGHKPENIKVTYNREKHILRIKDETMSPLKENSWYYKELNLEFTLPDTTDSESFVKSIENGVLMVTAYYDEEKKKNCADIEI